jgi:flagellar basal-body rod modification protein FlgD
MSVTYTTFPATSTSSATSASGTSVLAKDDFLKLLIVQLQNQDPLNPMEGTEFATQLAQFSSVEQLTNISDTLTESLTVNQLMTQSIGNSLATTMIGKDVKATGDSFKVTGSGDITLGYTLGSDAAKVTVKVFDQAGSLVRTMTVSNAEAGDGTVVWDGLNDNGSRVATGTFSFTVTAEDSAGTAITASTFITGTISAVRFTTEGTVFVVDGVEIPISLILEILNGKGNG